MNSKSKSIAMLIALCFAGCAGQDFGPLSQILSSTGHISSSQADSLLRAGQHVAKGVQSLSEEEEYYLGRGVAATVLSTYKPYRNPKVTSYVNKIAKVVSAASDRPETFGGYHVLVLDSNEVNAVSAPGGFIFLTKGFVNIVPDEDSLAAVLAHEVAHIVKGHGLKAISESNLSQAFILIGKEAAASQGGSLVQQLTSTFGDSVSDITNTLLSKGYSRSQEYEADTYASDLLVKSGYNPEALKSMLASLDASSKGEKGGWLSTHPEPNDRIEELDLPAAPSQSVASQAIRAKRFKQTVNKPL